MTVYAFNAQRSHKARLLHLEKVFNLLPGGQPHLAGGDRLHGKGELRTIPPAEWVAGRYRRPNNALQGTRQKRTAPERERWKAIG